MDNFNISNIYARQILDSRGNPTVEADVFLEGGGFGRAAVPSGASTGSGEALELRDGNNDIYGGKSVTGAVNNVNTSIKDALIGMDARWQFDIDKAMIDLDGTENKSNLGANAILAVSLASAKAVANQKNIPFYRHIAEIAENTDLSLPLPMMNIMNGGAHANWATDIQEFMIMPIGADTIETAIRMGAEVFHSLAKVLKEKDYNTTVGDEGGYAPRVKGGNHEPLALITEAVERAGYQPGQDISFAIDAAASEFYKDGSYQLKTENKNLSSNDIINWYKELLDKYPFVSMEDPFAEDDWETWQVFTSECGSKVQIVGDDLLVTNSKLLQRAIDDNACNSILIKLNQIGSLSETIDAVKLAKNHGFTAVISHRSGETEDTSISHLAVGLGAGQIKTGSLSRTDRVAKYNELIRIAESDPSLSLAHPF